MDPFLLFTQSVLILKNAQLQIILRTPGLLGILGKGHVAKLADALALGASEVTHGGSSPPLPTEFSRQDSDVKKFFLS